MSRYFKHGGLVMIAGMLLCVFRAEANNVTVSNVSVALPTSGTTHVLFDITWENSWRDALNYDACWVFMKYSTNSGATWAHATLAGAGTNPPGTAIGTCRDMEIVVPADKMGGFVQRTRNGSGTLDSTDVEFVWNFSSDGVVSTETVWMRVFAIEMVYVPTAAFRVGSGDDKENGCFYLYVGNNPKTNTYLIGSESSITTATEVGCLWGLSGTGGGNSVSPADPDVIPAEFPKGYNAFYCMKYEMSQRQYCDFLNTLTTTQQNNRVEAGLNFNTDRNFIKKSGSSPAYFGCDANDDAGSVLNADSSFLNESDDGEWVACNYMSWGDGCAYADWAGLRPMTEFEYEKACRGDQFPITDEYAWGNTTLESWTTSLSNQNTAAETPNQGNCNWGYCSPDGPYRSGCYADGTSARENADASYYGILDLSGNLVERAVSVGYAAGRGFTGLHGNGVLSTNGHANVANWPGLVAGEITTATGSGHRGGAWEGYSAEWMQVSMRVYAASAYNDDRLSNRGFRCVRSAP